jgi:hypothetical protein
MKESNKKLHSKSAYDIVKIAKSAVGSKQYV